MIRLSRWRLYVWALLALMTLPASLSAHAVQVGAEPPANEAVPVSPQPLAVRFSETVTLIRSEDLQVLDSSGGLVTGGPGRVSPGNARQIEVPLRPFLPDGTYTVRWFVVSADSHAIAGAYAFAVGKGPVGPLYTGGLIGRGPSETGIWAVSARTLELVLLGGLIGMLAWRWLVWRPAAAQRSNDANIWGRDLFWTGYGLLAAGSMLAEGYLLVVKSASILGTGVLATLKQPAEIANVLAETRFGALAQVRAALLFGVFVIAIWQFLTEMSPRAEGNMGPAGRPIPAALMALLTGGSLVAISTQGHASTAPFPPLSIAADVVHLVGASVWIGGMAMLLVTLWRAPTVLGAEGRALAGRSLARYSPIALIAVSVTVLAGVARALAGLSDITQLWETSYGRSIIYKLLLLCPIAFLGLRHRRIANAMRTTATPSQAALSMTRRSATLEILLSLAIVVVAALLVGQVPGRKG